MHFAMLVLRNKMSYENLQLAELAAFTAGAIDRSAV